MTESERFTVNDTDVKKIGTGLVIAVIGAVAVYLAENAGDLDFGEWGPLVGAMAAVIANAVRKFSKGPKKVT